MKKAILTCAALTLLTLLCADSVAELHYARPQPDY